MATGTGDGTNQGTASRAGEWALKVLGAFVILEPIWMLLPFAGFLYGSVLRIENLNRAPSTAWLTHFVFPVLTLGWLGPAMVVLGFGVFCVGASQIYSAKWRKSGLVSNGLYAIVRHPQYISLTLFGIGILLTWGRAMTFIAFFVMMFLYYFLSKSEERNCRRLFGDAYEAYRERTSFIIPGDRVLRPFGTWLGSLGLPAPVRVAIGLAVTLATCFALMWLIGQAKSHHLHVPHMVATVQFERPATQAPEPLMTSDEGGGIPFVQSGRLAVVRGPHRNAHAPGFAERLIQRLRSSRKLASFLSFLDDGNSDVAIIFCGSHGGDRLQGKAPGHRANPDGRGPLPDEAGPARTRLVLMRCELAEGKTVADALADKGNRRIVRACIAVANLGTPEDAEIVEEDGRTRGPGFPGDERWDDLTRRFAELPGTAASTLATAASIAEGHTCAALVLVQAPILRTRLDPPFAKEILSRLAGSAQFREHLQTSGAGGDVVAVAFPRPGPNWYREHHGDPQVSVLVVLARVPDPEKLDAIFKSGERELTGAFIADIDLKISHDQDCVTSVATVGPRRDLEQRWRFFLSGIGGGLKSHGHRHATGKAN
ncbi:MAG: isoprenylcysteine carboxylmethyltransferase family protein [Lentisphaerae bacterium]|jgi:protein-S-isoprenylcysteine O-methyltransferase Ste14|nr:isoprenylcysteine carboxylmethyltransferase family protein [Lentisphaerota bacterium]MBT4817908.1 isoprenylcysteine carboxylmethyltransferase family protein [Lentisphaerota bacterium]MBT5607693.1 isoprenylcysteine carboxylmethyltransferase family protein [Lentisphaerota bacterium]MBT7061296.1 isoprenylcysteine carboxylmethyltransferase family protein [Lentisphaerota bacterium]MBT7847383.1 isoprenylcysteine carboxylmethyltransferase family protein [Lentisphaerota bacterium]